MDKSDAHTSTLEGSSINLTDPFLERFRIRKRRDYSARDSSLEGEPSKCRAMESAFKQTEPVFHDPFAEYVCEPCRSYLQCCNHVPKESIT